MMVWLTLKNSLNDSGSTLDLLVLNTNEKDAVPTEN